MRMSAAKKPRTFFLSEAALFFEKSVDKIIYKAMFKIYSISRLLRRSAVRDAYGLEKIHGVLFGGCNDGGKCRRCGAAGRAVYIECARFRRC